MTLFLLIVLSFSAFLYFYAKKDEHNNIKYLEFRESAFNFTKTLTNDKKYIKIDKLADSLAVSYWRFYLNPFSWGEDKIYNKKAVYYEKFKIWNNK